MHLTFDYYRLVPGQHKNAKNESSYVIPMNQHNYRMIKGMFEKRTKFQDSLFYDVSAWTLPLAFDLNYSYNSKMFLKQHFYDLRSLV